MTDSGEPTLELDSARAKKEEKKLKERREQLIGDHMERYNELYDLTKMVLWQYFGKPDRDITYEDVVARLDEVLQMKEDVFFQFLNSLMYEVDDQAGHMYNLDEQEEFLRRMKHLYNDLYHPGMFGDPQTVPKDKDENGRLIGRITPKKPIDDK